MPDSSGLGDSSLSELASLMALPECSRDTTEAGMRALQRSIENLAMSIVAASNGRRQWVAQDFVAGSSSLIFELLRNGNYDRAKGPFKAWCYRVLQTRFISEIRAQKRHQLSSLDATQPNAQPILGNVADPATAFTEAIDLQDYQHEPLSEMSLKRIGCWPTRHRVILLSLALLWTRVPAERWSEWCFDCDISEPFPPADFLDHTPQRCQEIVANALGITLNHLYVLKYRIADRLAELVPDAPVVSHILRRRSGKLGGSPGGGQ